MLPFKATRSPRWVLILTFLAYASFHMSRKPPSIIKPVLHPTSPDGNSAYDAAADPGWAPFSQDLIPSRVQRAGLFHCAGMDCG